jgi:hypothetical protein
MPHSPSLLSGTRASKSTRAVKKVAKSVGKAVKKGAAAISRPFKKRRKLSSESDSVGTFVFFSVVAKFLTESYIYITVSNDGNSTRETSTRDPSTREPSVIEIDASDEEGSTADETPEEELGKYSS